MKKMPLLFGVATGAVLGIAFGIIWGSPARAAALDVRRVESEWEYRLEPKVGTPMDRPTNNDHVYQRLFDNLGKDGWEFAGSFGGGEGRGPGFALVFRRPKR
jgi:hypothetical protein